jgi:hypothetical protein
MAEQKGTVSENGKRIMKNTIALYFRMGFLMIISLFSARIILNSLGVCDKGVYDAVASFVAMMAILTNSLSTAISRFITVEIGKGDEETLAKVFATSKAVILAICALVFVVMEPLGVWYIGNVINIPPDRISSAQWVFQFSLVTFVVTLMSIPYNSAIIAHERMSVFGIVGVFEGVAKLAVALAIRATPIDRLIAYSFLLCLVSILVRSIYTGYCRRSFSESRSRARMDRGIFLSMTRFAGWSGLSSGVFMLNTQGVTLLMNYFFGVVFNTMRGIATNVENMIKQFVLNVFTSINPQVMKSFVSGDREYSFTLACKGCKYSFLIIFVLGLPFLFEADLILKLWLGDIVPAETSLFTKLALLCLMADLLVTPMANVIQASGKLRKFYLVTSLINIMVFPVTWLLYFFGAPAWTCYLAFFLVYSVCDVVRLLILRSEVGFPISMFVREVVLKIVPVAVISLAATFLLWRFIPAGAVRLLTVLVLGTLCTAGTSYLFALTEGERSFVNSKVVSVYSSVRNFFRGSVAER